MLESLAESSLLRISLVLLTVLGVQTSFLSEVRPFGGVVDIVAVLAAVTGLIAGPRRGARAGFMFGIGFDLLIATPFGIKGLAYGLAAFAVGLLPDEPITNVRFLVPMIAAGGAALAVLAEGIVAAIFGRGEAFSRDLFAAMIVSAAVGALLGPVAKRAVRWAMMGADRARF
jgi:rod shape-determining protein MreD